MAIYKIDGAKFNVLETVDGDTIGDIRLLLESVVKPVPAEVIDRLVALKASYIGHSPHSFYAEYGEFFFAPAPETPQDTSSAIGYVSGVLKQAAEEVGGRATTYDSPQGEESMPKTVQMFNALYDKDLTPEQGWQFMAILKMVRSSQGEFKRDNYVDEAAYAAFACKAAQDKANENG